MRHVRMLGLCMVAALAVAAVVTTSASALPEFGQCYKLESHEGRYTNNVCTKKAKKVEEKFTGEFEWRKATEIEHRHFVGSAGAGILLGRYIACEKNGSTSNLDTEYGRKGLPCPEGDHEELLLGKAITVECESESNHGEIAATKASKEVKNISVIFRGCKALGSIPCTNTINEGEIQVNALKGKLGFISKKTTPREVGLLLEPAVKKGEFAKFNCGGTIETVVGEGNETEGCAYPQKACGGDGIISAVTPVNTITSELTQTFVMNEETAENVPSKFEGTAPLKELESYIFNPEEPERTTQWSKAAESITNVAKGEEAGEIKAN